MWSPKPRADASRMQWPCFPADKHCVHNSPCLATGDLWENKALSTRNSNADSFSGNRKRENV